MPPSGRRLGGASAIASVAALALALGAPSPAAAAKRSCQTVRVTPTGDVSVIAAPEAAVELRDRPRADTAYFVSATRTSCAEAWNLVGTVIPALAERAAVRAAGYRVIAIRAFRSAPGGPAVHRVIAGRGRARISYVRSGAGWVRQRVFLQSCAAAERRLLARAPSRRVARAGGKRVRLKPRRRICSPRKRLRGEAANLAFTLPEVPSAESVAPAPAGCLIPPDAVGLGLAGVLVSRRSWCSRVDQIDARALVVVITPWGTEERLVGTGKLAMLRRIDFVTAGSGADAQVDLGYLGLTGVIARFATFEVRMRCEFAFGTTCAAIPNGSPGVLLTSGGFGHVEYRLEPGAMAGGNRDFMQPWIELRLRAFIGGGLGKPFVIASTPRPRCDTEAPGQGCVWADFDPTMTYRSSQTPEIAAHIAAAQAAGQPGGRASGRPLTRTNNANRNANRREACPRALIRRYRRERPGGSCDEYPFASTRQGGRRASTANVPEREQRIQGAIVAGFYASQRVLTGDNFWVASR